MNKNKLKFIVINGLLVSFLHLAWVLVVVVVFFRDDFLSIVCIYLFGSLLLFGVWGIYYYVISESMMFKKHEGKNKDGGE